MRILIRLMLLGVFAAGVGLAVTLALHMDGTSGVEQRDGPLAKLLVRRPQSPKPTSATVELAAIGPPPESAPTLDTPAPILAEYQPAVANEVSPRDESARESANDALREPLARFDEKLTQIETVTREQQQTFNELRSAQKTVEQQLDLVRQTAAQNQFARLEEKLDRIENASFTRPKPYVAARDDVEESDTVAPNVRTASLSNKPVSLTAAGLDVRIAKRPAADVSIQKKDTEDTLYSLNLRNDDLRDVLEYLSEESNLNILPSENVHGSVTASLSNVDLQTAVEAILRSTGFVARRDGDFLYVGTKQDLARMDQMHEEIDTRIYRTNYVTAAELEKLITPMLSVGISFISVSSPAKKDIPPDNVSTGSDDFAGAEVLLVRDYVSVLKQIDALVSHVDQRPQQVAIEAMILSVELNDNFRMGIDFEVLRRQKNIRLIAHSPLANLANIDVSEGGLNIGFLDGELAGFIQAIESMGNVNVVAAPRLLCLNKQRAEILIGDQKGYLSTTQTETAATQTVEFLDIGTQLRIRPFISSDGMVRLEVHPELSSGDVKLLGEFALPEKSVTQVTTNIMCPDGCTVVLGGLIREEIAESISQVPVVGNVPLVGKLFRRKSESVSRSEIVVLITPRIIYDPAECEDAAACASDLALRRLPKPPHQMNATARRHYAQRYYRLAQAAWEAGNAPAAMQYLELTLQLHPKHRDALDLYGVVSSAAHQVVFEQELPAEHEVLPLAPATRATTNPHRAADN